MLYETLFASFSKKNRVELKQNLEKVFAVNLSLKNLRNVGARLLDIFKDSDLVPFSQLLDNIKILDSAMQLSKRPVLVYGGASSGKSTITKVACMDNQKSILHLYVSDMKFDKLIGTYVGSSNTWQDGILPMMIRTNRLDSKNVVLFDVANGTDFPDVALNGIDDNVHHTAYQICLPTGERLDISSNVIIESSQISCFSPRDLSNSLIYCSNVDVFGMEYAHHGCRCIKKNICIPSLNFRKQAIGVAIPIHDCEFSLFKTTTPRSIRDIGDIFWVT